MWITLLVVLLFAACPSNCEQYTFRITDRFVSKCANVYTDNSIVQNQTSFKITTYSESTRATDFIEFIDETTGEEQRLAFPGCYDLQLDLKLEKPILNPYAEVFLKLGDALPCNNDISGCSKSTNPELLRLTRNQETCRFCNLCDYINQKSFDHKWVRLISQQAGNLCTVRGNLPYMLRLRFCTPTSAEFQTSAGIFGDIFRNKAEYLELLRQGYLEIVIHLLERQPNLQDINSPFCRSLKSQSNDTLASTAFSRYCSPRDTYSTCLYMSTAFSVS